MWIRNLRILPESHRPQRRLHEIHSHHSSKPPNRRRIAPFFWKKQTLVAVADPVDAVPVGSADRCGPEFVSRPLHLHDVLKRELAASKVDTMSTLLSGEWVALDRPERKLSTLITMMISTGARE